MRSVGQNSTNCLFPYKKLFTGWPVATKAPYNFTWPVRHYPHSAMISTALPSSGPTALAVALAGCCTVPTSLNVHLMYRSYIMTAGQDRPCCYLRFVPAEVKTAIPTVGKEIFVLSLNVNAANTQCYMAADYRVLCRRSLCV